MIKLRATTDIDISFRQRHISKWELFVGFAGVVLIGIPSFRTGMRIFNAKKKHPVTLEEYYLYDPKSRRYASMMILIGLAVLIHALFIYPTYYL